MGEHVDKLAAHHVSAEDPGFVALARIVRTQEGSKRFRAPVGTPITKKMREAAKARGDSPVDASKGKVQKAANAKVPNSKLFQMRVAELREAIEKLDTNAIKNLLKQLEDAKDLPKSANYQKIREMLKTYLKKKAGRDDEAKDKIKK